MTESCSDRVVRVGFPSSSSSIAKASLLVTSVWPICRAFAEFCDGEGDIFVATIGGHEFAVSCVSDTEAIKEILEKYEVVK